MEAVGKKPEARMTHTCSYVVSSSYYSTGLLKRGSVGSPDTFTIHLHLLNHSALIPILFISAPSLDYLDMAAPSTDPSQDDIAKDRYGDTLFPREIGSPLVHLSHIGEQHAGSSIKVRAWVQNVRMQGKKMAFVELREEGSWSIQALVVAGAEISREMVKWVASLRPESFLSVEGTIKRPLDPVKSCRVTDWELHLTKVYCEAPAPEKLGLNLASANKAVTRVDDEDTLDDSVEKLTLSGSAIPGASLVTHMTNPVMHKRAPVQQAIADLRMSIRRIFSEYLDVRGFNLFEPPCLIGAASEGGAEVFKMPYFGKEAYLAQSAQFYKQIEIAGGRKKVYSIGPTFRAEKSNTRRHLTEVRECPSPT